MNEQEIRAAALQAATALKPEGPKALTAMAARLAEWIKTGELPAPPAGTWEA